MISPKPILLCGSKKCCPKLYVSGKNARVTDDFGGDQTKTRDEWRNLTSELGDGSGDPLVSIGGLQMHHSQAKALRSNI